VTSTTRDRYPAGEAVAGLLAACALFLGALELVYRPFRLAPAALVLALAATIMTRTQQRLVGLAFAVIGVCFVVGAALQVVTHHPLF
jgi:drug/metabolite transporter superfamily protein YnfA